MKYLMIANGRGESFQHQSDELKELTNKASSYLAKDMTCEVYIKHSDLEIGEVVVVRTEDGAKMEEAAIKEAEIKG